MGSEISLLQWEVGENIQLNYSTAVMNPGEKTHEDNLGV